MEAREKILDKVQKILALAGNNPSQAEAQVALAKAQKMMAEHNIRMSELEATNDMTQEVVKESPNEKYTRMPAWWTQMAEVIGANFRCKVYVGSINGNQEKVYFMGLKDDVQIAKTLWSFAKVYVEYQAKKLRANFRKQGRPTDGIMGDYAEGFIQGMREKFREQVATDSSLALMVVIPQEVTEAWNQMKFGQGTIKQSKRAFNAEAYDTGKQHGKSFDSPKGFIE